MHPTKKEVRYKNTNQVFNFIYSAIDDALTRTIEKPEPQIVSKPQEQDEEIYVEEGEMLSSLYEKPKPVLELVRPEPQKPVSNYTPKQSAPIQTQFVETNKIQEEENIIGQYKKTYILIEHEYGLEIVDQHIAEERYIYEQLKKSKNIDCQLLFISDVLEVSPTDKEILEVNKDKLQKFGYEIDFISDHEVIFRKVPQLLSKVSPKEILADILEHISGNIDNIEEQILITTSCKAAVKANTYLNHFQMQEIIKNWRGCEKPYTCPHGRPISHVIEHKDIAKFFERSK